LVAARTTTQIAGRQIHDTTIHAGGQAKLTADRFSNIVNIEARRVSGVVRVFNDLQVKWPPSA